MAEVAEVVGSVPLVGVEVVHLTGCLSSFLGLDLKKRRIIMEVQFCESISSSVLIQIDKLQLTTFLYQFSTIKCIHKVMNLNLNQHYNNKSIKSS